MGLVMWYVELVMVICGVGDGDMWRWEYVYFWALFIMWRVCVYKRTSQMTVKDVSQNHD